MAGNKSGGKQGTAETYGKAEEADGEAAAAFITQICGHVGATTGHG